MTTSVELRTFTVHWADMGRCLVEAMTGIEALDTAKVYFEERGLDWKLGVPHSAKLATDSDIRFYRPLSEVS